MTRGCTGADEAGALLALALRQAQFATGDHAAVSELLEHLVVAAEVPDTRTSQSVVRAARRSPAELESERGNLDAALDETQQRLAEVQSIHVQEAHMLPILREPTTMPACSARHSERATKRDPPRDNPRDTLTAEI